MSQKILLVDDDQDLLDALSFSFEIKGFECYCSTNPHEAIDRLHNDPSITLLFFDYQMPQMSAKTFTQSIQDHPARKVLFTGHMLSDEMKQMLLSGLIDDYVNKSDLAKMESVL